MARDSSLPLRVAILTYLRADGARTGPAPSERVYGLATPPDPIKPFTRYGTPTVLPDRASCVDGSRILVTLHAFSDADSEDEASEIAAAMASALDGATLTLAADYEAKARIAWTGGQILPDPEEASSWHAVVNFEATVTS